MKKRNYLFIAIFLFVLISTSVYRIEADAKEASGVNSQTLIQTIKKSVVFLGSLDGEGNPFYSGTGFLIKVHKYYYLVTAKHVVFDNKNGVFIDKNMFAFFNSKDGKITMRSIEEVKQKYKKNKFRWLFHENPAIDIAVLPFELNMGLDDVTTIPDGIFLFDEINKYELDDVFLLSYDPWAEKAKKQAKVSPVIRGGIVSRSNDDGSFYIDATVFPGNSGSPVFLKSPFRFIGIAGAYVPYREIAYSGQTGLPRMIFEENTGLSVVWPAEYINDILKQVSNPIY